jgi:hypothetical protein
MDADAVPDQPGQGPAEPGGEPAWAALAFWLGRGGQRGAARGRTGGPVQDSAVAPAENSARR